MEIIPVLDLMQGQVVRAQRGNRQLYRPIRSQLCDSSEPECVAEALLQLYPFDSLYIADLDAIQGSGDNLPVITALRKRYRHIDFWLDAGFNRPEQIDSAQALGLGCIIASERLESLAQYELLLGRVQQEAALLSLDFGPGGFIGPQQLLDRPDLWPQRLICMTLGRVGSYAGPDFAQLGKLIAHSGEHEIYAAGGVRDLADLEHLAHIGAAGVLVASALHDRKITHAQIARWLK